MYEEESEANIGPALLSHEIDKESKFDKLFKSAVRRTPFRIMQPPALLRSSFLAISVCTPHCLRIDVSTSKPNMVGPPSSSSFLLSFKYQSDSFNRHLFLTELLAFPTNERISDVGYNATALLPSLLPGLNTNRRPSVQSQARNPLVASPDPSFSLFFFVEVLPNSGAIKTATTEEEEE